MLSNAKLYIRITGHELDDYGSELKFSQRLAGENLWSHEYAKRVIHEYKRFMYLAALGIQQVTPSDEVDQAWHLHLLYSQDYADFCSNVLGVKINHGPTKGGKKEDKRYDEQYKKTQVLYGKEFSQHPPDDIWPCATIRFGTPYARVNMKDNWVVPVGDKRALVKLLFKSLKPRL
jgi:hypothetical protein